MFLRKFFLKSCFFNMFELPDWVIAILFSTLTSKGEALIFKFLKMFQEVPHVMHNEVDLFCCFSQMIICNTRFFSVLVWTYFVIKKIKWIEITCLQLTNCNIEFVWKQKLNYNGNYWPKNILLKRCNEAFFKNTCIFFSKMCG